MAYCVFRYNHKRGKRAACEPENKKLEVWLTRIRHLRRLMGLEAIYQAPRTSMPSPAHWFYPYLLEGVVIDRRNQDWCADSTYIPVRRGVPYLVAIMSGERRIALDWATRRGLAWRHDQTAEDTLTKPPNCPAMWDHLRRHDHGE